MFLEYEIPESAQNAIQAKIQAFRRIQGRKQVKRERKRGTAATAWKDAESVGKAVVVQCAIVLAYKIRGIEQRETAQEKP